MMTLGFGLVSTLVTHAMHITDGYVVNREAAFISMSQKTAQSFVLITNIVTTKTSEIYQYWLLHINVNVLIQQRLISYVLL